MSLNPTHLQLLSAYVDGELTAAERETVERALAADPRMREVERSMRGLGSAMRATSEAEVGQADFSALADRIMARVPRRPGVLDRLRAVLSRSWVPIGGVVAVAVGAFFALRPVTPARPVATGVDVQSASVVESQPELRPVVHKTETGDAIIWLVEKPDASGNHRATPLPNDKPGAQAPVPPQQRKTAGEL
ncbi:MAG TPA: zf-HC2 domain-containing protein [Myxococcaceae bacterium]|nr:zf-HC2 domain-containing protein [Myxococcaceae bacterium]